MMLLLLLLLLLLRLVVVVVFDLFGRLVGWSVGRFAGRRWPLPNEEVHPIALVLNDGCCSLLLCCWVKMRSCKK